MPMMAITISSSMSLKPGCFFIVLKKRAPIARDPYRQANWRSDLLLGALGPLNERAIRVRNVLVEVGRRAANSDPGRRAVPSRRTNQVVVARAVTPVVVEPAPAVDARRRGDVGRRQEREGRDVDH